MKFKLRADFPNTDEYPCKFWNPNTPSQMMKSSAGEKNVKFLNYKWESSALSTVRTVVGIRKRKTKMPVARSRGKGKEMPSHELQGSSSTRFAILLIPSRCSFYSRALLDHGHNTMILSTFVSYQ